MLWVVLRASKRGRREVGVGGAKVVAAGLEVPSNERVAIGIRALVWHLGQPLSHDPVVTSASLAADARKGPLALGFMRERPFSFASEERVRSFHEQATPLQGVHHIAQFGHDIPCRALFRVGARELDQRTEPALFADDGSVFEHA